MLRRRVNVSRSATESGGLVSSTPNTRERRSVPFPAVFADELAALMIGKGHDDLVFTELLRTHCGPHLSPNANYSVDLGNVVELRGFEPRTEPGETGSELRVLSSCVVRPALRMLRICPGMLRDVTVLDPN